MSRRTRLILTWLLMLLALAVVPIGRAIAQTPPAADAPRVWDVTKVTCQQLLVADDDDRAAALMFYYGYLAAQAGIKMIDVNKIDANVHRVMEQCGKAPTQTVPQAFDVAFGRKPRK